MTNSQESDIPQTDAQQDVNDALKSTASTEAHQPTEAPAVHWLATDAGRMMVDENDPFARHAKPSSAAVAIRARWDADLTDVIPAVKGLVKNAIEGLQYEKIMVTVFKDSPPKK